MKIDFPLGPGLALQISSGADRDSQYPTARLQKGLVQIADGEDLSEEAVGFGVPILKRGLQTIFPGEVELYLHKGESGKKVSARYKLNLEERITRSDRSPITSRLVYTVKNSLAAAIRQLPWTRRMLTRTSSLLRSRLDWKTTYIPSDFRTYVVLSYSMDEPNGKIQVELRGGDFLTTSINEIILMNELGAHHFDQYSESNGIHQSGDQIGCWDPVKADEASFIATSAHLSFSLRQVEGAKLYRGRELIEPRLAWSGFGYTVPPALKSFSYEITVKKLV